MRRRRRRADDGRAAERETTSLPPDDDRPTDAADGPTRRRRRGRSTSRARSAAGRARAGPVARGRAAAGRDRVGRGARSDADGGRRRRFALDALASRRDRRRRLPRSVLVVGIDLWTDAIWYRSVGFDSVFWTRLGAQAGCSRRRASSPALILLLGNLWLAGRLAPPPSDAGAAAARCAGLLDRPQRGRGHRRPAAGGGATVRPVAGAGGDGPASPSTPRARSSCPTSCPAGGRCPSPSIGGPDRPRHRRVACRPAGRRSCSGSTACRSSPIRRPPVVDPIFGRDIGFFLFELPFLRLVQGVFNGLVVAASLAGRRRATSSAASRGSLVFATPRPRPPRRPRRPVPAVGRRSATSSTSSSSSTATAASRPASATPTRTPSSSPSTSLTVLSGARRGVPRGRRVHPGALAARA